MKPVLIVRHEDWIESGHLADTLTREGIPYEICAIHDGDPVPAEPNDYAGLVFVGGTMSVNDGYAWVDDEVALIRRAHARDIPVLGHCFGSQLCALALDAPVYAMSQKEIGWHPVRRGSGEATREWLGAGPDEFEILIWHHDGFDLPAGAESLYSSAFCPNQAFARGNLAATVAHVEVTPEQLRRWIEVYGYDLDPLSDTVQDAVSVLDDAERRIETMQRNITDPLYRRWLRPVRERAAQ